MQKDKYIITQEGHNKLKKEYQFLVEVEKPRAIIRVKEAREMGSLEDNPEYYAAREELGLLEGRALEIEDILDRAEIAKKKGAAPASRVGIGSVVTVQIDGELDIFEIVSSVEADPGNGKISDESPVGRALLECREDQEVTVKLAHTTLKYKVLKVDSS